MADDIKTHTYSFREVAALLIRARNVTEGHWGVAFRFGVQGASIGVPGEGEVVPAAIVPVLEIGLQRFNAPNALTVDAAELAAELAKD